MNSFQFNVTSNFEDIYIPDDLKHILNNPSNLHNVIMPYQYHYNNIHKSRILDFTGTTIQQAIQKILTFYKHQTFRRMIGERQLFNGFSITYDSNNNPLTILNLL
jgi:hypothetical protein